MADFKAALRTRLQADAAVAALTTKVAWSAVPANTALPYIRLQGIGGNEGETLDGPAGLKRRYVTVDSFGLNSPQASDLAEVARKALLGSATVSGIRFVRTDAELPRDVGEDVPGVGFVHLAKFSAEIDYTGD